MLPCVTKVDQSDLRKLQYVFNMNNNQWFFQRSKVNNFES